MGTEIIIGTVAAIIGLITGISVAIINKIGAKDEFLTEQYNKLVDQYQEDVIRLRKRADGFDKFLDEIRQLHRLEMEQLKKQVCYLESENENLKTSLHKTRLALSILYHQVEKMGNTPIIDIDKLDEMTTAQLQMFSDSK